jgi:OmpA family
MNRLLSFNPEPFESNLDLENTFQARGATRGDSEKESELEYVGARGRNLRFLKPLTSSLREGAIRADLRTTQGPPTTAAHFMKPALVTSPAEQTTQCTVYGWSQYKRRVEELPPDQQAILKSVGGAIIASYKPGGQHVRNVKVYGHSDWDTPRNPQREQQISNDRARVITDWLKNHVGNAIAAQMRWDTQGFGATKLKVIPTTEANRRRNRRVEIMLISDYGPQPDRNQGYPLVRHNRLVGNLVGIVHPSGPQTKNMMLAFHPMNGPIVGQVRIPIANVREDVMNAMNRLHVLWSMSNPDYDAEYPVVDKLLPGSTVDVRLIPRTVEAIIRNHEPTIHQQVANYFLNQSLRQPVGRNLTNLKSDVLLVQTSLRALGLLSDADFISERAAMMPLTTVSNADAVMPKTLAAIARLKDAIAGFRLGWDPLQADESEAGGDRYGGRTFNFTVTSRCFVPGVGEQSVPHRVAARSAGNPHGSHLWPL